MQDHAKQEFLAKQTIRERTTDCKDVWGALEVLRERIKDGTETKHLMTLIRIAEDAFCDFECSWEQHAKEYHS